MIAVERDTGSDQQASARPAPVRLTRRRLPYPFRAMLAICSDLDETPGVDTYLESLRFLNTTERTAMGTGAGLEVGNSLYFDMAPGQVSYWNADDRGRAAFRTLIRSGHIDCLHSYGDTAVTRAHAARALDELDRHGCRFEVWIDHAIAPTNLGADIMRGTGDVRGAAAYHADLTCAHGIRFVWRGRVTSVTGQDAPRDVGTIFSPAHRAASTKTLAKEATKGLLGRASDRSRYAMHATNRLLRPVSLRSGHAVEEFIRFNPHWGGVSCGDTADGLAEVLTEPMLEALAAREGVGVLYTHLGKVSSRTEPFNAATRDALHRLAAHQAAGSILVTTSRRLLGYCAAVRDLSFTASENRGTLAVEVRTAAGVSAADLQGLTFHTPATPARATLAINGAPPVSLVVNPPDDTGLRSVSLPWIRLAYPQL
jgi:hypothetical protein